MSANGMGPQHGTRSRYRKGCREECCRGVERAYRRRWRIKTGRVLNPQPQTWMR